MILAHYNTHEIYRIYPMIVISETPGLLITFGTISVVDLSKRRIIEPSLTAFIGFPFALMYTFTFTNITKYMSFRILFEICSRVSRLNSHAKVLSKAPHFFWAIAKNKTLRSEYHFKSTSGSKITLASSGTSQF